MNDVTETSSGVKHRQLSQNVADDADRDAEEGDDEITFDRRNKKDFQKEFDPTRNGRQPKEMKKKFLSEIIWTLQLGNNNCFNFCVEY